VVITTPVAMLLWSPHAQRHCCDRRAP